MTSAQRSHGLVVLLRDADDAREEPRAGVRFGEPRSQEARSSSAQDETTLQTSLKRTPLSMLPGYRSRLLGRPLVWRPTRLTGVTT